MPLAFAHVLSLDPRLSALGWAFLVLGWVKVALEVIKEAKSWNDTR